MIFVIYLFKRCCFTSTGGDPSSSLSADGSVLSVERLVPYPAFNVHHGHSYDEALNDFIFDHVIPEEAALLDVVDCAQSIVRHSRKMSTPDGNSVDVSQLVPDLTLSSLPPHEHLSEKDIQIDTSSRQTLGSGGFATVLLGYHGDEEVAIKAFGSISISDDEKHVEITADHVAGTDQHSIEQTESRQDAATSDTECQPVRSTLFHTLDEARDDGRKVTIFTVLQLEAFHYFKQLQDLVQEVTIMKQLKHKNIAQFKGVILEPCPCLVMEFAPGGNLASLIRSRRDHMAPIDDLLNGEHFCDVAHDGILGRELTHRIAFQVKNQSYLFVSRDFTS